MKKRTNILLIVIFVSLVTNGEYLLYINEDFASTNDCKGVYSDYRANDILNDSNELLQLKDVLHRIDSLNKNRLSEKNRSITTQTQDSGYQCSQDGQAIEKAVQENLDSTQEPDLQNNTHNKQEDTVKPRKGKTRKPALLPSGLGRGTNDKRYKSNRKTQKSSMNQKATHPDSTRATPPIKFPKPKKNDNE